MKQRAGTAGYTFPFVLILLAAAAAGGMRLEWSGNYDLRRDREEELLFRGRAYIRAIGAFYTVNSRYPRTLAELGGESEPGRPRYIRKRYQDPLTGRDFEPVLTEEGWIAGVASASSAAPLRKADFEKELLGFENARTYSDWKFVWRQQRDGS